MKVILWNEEMELGKAIESLKKYKHVSKYNDERMRIMLKYCLKDFSIDEMIKYINEM